MSIQTDIPRLVVASFDDRDDHAYLRARTEDGVELIFELDPMALAVLGLTLDMVLRAARDRLKDQVGLQPKPTAPDSPEGLEG